MISEILFDFFAEETEIKLAVDDDYFLLALRYLQSRRRVATHKKKFFPCRIIHYRGRAVKSLKKSFKTAKENAGISRRLRLYDFRHAFASMILKYHGDLKSVSEILGHSRTDTTTRIYQHTDSDMHRAAIERLPAIDFDPQKVGQKKSR